MINIIPKYDIVSQEEFNEIPKETIKKYMVFTTGYNPDISSEPFFEIHVLAKMKFQELNYEHAKGLMIKEDEVLCTVEGEFKNQFQTEDSKKHNPEKDFIDYNYEIGIYDHIGTILYKLTEKNGRATWEIPLTIQKADVNDENSLPTVIKKTNIIQEYILDNGYLTIKKNGDTIVESIKVE